MNTQCAADSNHRALKPPRTYPMTDDNRDICMKGPMIIVILNNPTVNTIILTHLIDK